MAVHLILSSIILALLLMVALTLIFTPVRDFLFGAIVWPLLGHRMDKNLRKIKDTLFKRARLRGHVLEIGAGDGVNLAYFAQFPEITQVVLIEPNVHLFKKLQKTVANSKTPVFLFQGTLSEYIDMHGQQRFDFVVSTLVMCSVDSLQRNLDLVKKILAPKGSFVFIEHVMDNGSDSRRLWVQKTLEPLWHGMSGCHLTRNTAHAILTQFGTADIEPFEHGPAPWLVRPHIRGIAVVA
eukprot:m.44228 g.44228  ORF g.44228 m.44228 type:complete len:238 (-) comp10882_c0_seq1:33-746(-)